MTIAARGVDCSEIQPRLPWPDWLRSGLQVGVMRLTIGYRADFRGHQHYSDASDAGVPILGAYHAILHHNHPDLSDTNPPIRFDPTQQCIAFLGELNKYHFDFSVLDVEAEGVTSPMVLRWCDYYDAHCRLPLLLYGNMSLEFMLGADNPRYAHYGLWVSDYGFFKPGTKELPIRMSHPTETILPRTPKVGHKAGWQWGGNNGRYPPYQGAIDLTDWYDLDYLRGEHMDSAEIRKQLKVIRDATTFIENQLPNLPPPVPVVLHTMTGMTNQQVVNVLYAAARDLGLESGNEFPFVVKCRLSEIANHRPDLYKGPAVEALPLSDVEKAAIIKRLPAG